MLLPFVLSSAYWAVQFAEELVRVQVFMLDSTRRHESDHDVISFAPLFNAIILINVRRVGLSSTTWRICTELCLVPHLGRDRRLESVGTVSRQLSKSLARPHILNDRDYL